MEAKSYTFVSDDGIKLVIKFVDGEYQTEVYYPDGRLEVLEGIRFLEWKYYKDEEGNTIITFDEGAPYKKVKTNTGKVLYCPLAFDNEGKIWLFPPEEEVDENGYDDEEYWDEEEDFEEDLDYCGPTLLDCLIWGEKGFPTNPTDEVMEDGEEEN